MENMKSQNNTVL